MTNKPITICVPKQTNMAEETEDDDEDGSHRHQKNKSKRPYVSAEQSYMQKLYMWHSTKVELLLKTHYP